MKAGFRRTLAILLERQAKRFIVRHKLKVVAVAGSVGKTTTRSAIATVLRQKLKTQAIHNLGYNSEIGLPLSIFELPVPRFLFNPIAWVWILLRTEAKIRRKHSVQVLVLELGTDHPGEIGRYLGYLKPDIAVITAVTPEHMENFESLDAVAAEELGLVPSSGYVLASAQIPSRYQKQYIDKHGAHDYFGTGKGLGYGVQILSEDLLAGTNCQISKHSRHALKVKLRVYGSAAVSSCLAAYAVADRLGLSAEQIKKGLESVRSVPGRMNILEGLNGSILIDDSYNSSPSALEASLAALAAAKVSGRRIAILGSMNELGSDSPKYHEEGGALAAALDLLITVGDLAGEYLGPAAVRAGLDPSLFKPADSPQAAADYLKLLLSPGDVVLVKGSQNGVFTEEAVKLLLDKPKDTRHLVRQTDHWLRLKSNQFKNS